MGGGMLRLCPRRQVEVQDGGSSPGSADALVRFFSPGARPSPAAWVGKRLNADEGVRAPRGISTLPLARSQTS
jgi:hypothetical protein